MKIFWFIPTHGDSRYLGTSKGARQVDHAYMKQIAVAVDNLGYEGVLIPTGRSCEDPWITAASLIDATKNLKFLVALRPGVTTPALAARMAATFDRLSNGRVLLNLVTGGDEQELKGDGVYEDHATRYKTAAEYTKIWREILTRSHTGESFTFKGKRLQVEDAKVLILGLSFKENCPDIRNTRIIDIVNELKEYHTQIDVYDPWVDAAEAEHEYGISPISNLENGKYDAVILAVAHHQFKDMGVQAIRALGKSEHVLYDLKYVLSQAESDLRL